MAFHLGKPILVLTLIAISSGANICLRKAPERAELEVWTFANSHAASYRGDASTLPGKSLVDQFTAKTGRSVEVKLINGSALTLRLGSAFDRHDLGTALPDVAEIEIGSVGRFFRPAVDEVGFLPLNDYLDRSDWRKRLVEARLAPWTKQGVIFGFPHDVHPVSISYRKDLFDQAGVDLVAARTWQEFHEKCLAFQRYWAKHGYPQRHAMELPTSVADYLNVMLQQRGINALDDQNRIHLSDPKVADTIAFYATLVAGPTRIAADATPGGQLWVNDFTNGDLCALMTPDWRASYLRTQSGGVTGIAAMMPLPRFDPTDAPTASWGGTMSGIPRGCKDPDSAWQLLTFLVSSRDGLEARWKATMILPPVTDLWNEPVYHQPDPFFCNQKTGELYIALARQLPRRYVTPYTALAQAQLSNILTRAVRRVNEGATLNLQQDIQRWLDDAAVDLQQRIEFSKFGG